MTARFDEEHDETMAAMVRALETSLEVAVPEGFAARVMARIPQTSPALSLQCARALTPRYGRIAAFCGLAALMIAMVLITHLVAASTFGTTLQLILLTQVCAYTLWIGTASWRRG